MTRGTRIHTKKRDGLLRGQASTRYLLLVCRSTMDPQAILNIAIMLSLPDVALSSHFGKHLLFVLKQLFYENTMPKSMNIVAHIAYFKYKKTRFQSAGGTCDYGESESRVSLFRNRCSCSRTAKTRFWPKSVFGASSP